LLRFLSAALADNRLYIRPLYELIADYAEFVGTSASSSSPSVCLVVIRLSSLPASVETVFVAAYSTEFRGLAINGDHSFVIADDGNVHRFDAGTKRIESIGCGQKMTAVCADPKSAGCHFVTSIGGVHYCDGSSVKPIAGGGVRLADGVGSAAGFGWLCGIACTSDGRTLYVTENGDCAIRQIDVKTRTVRTAISASCHPHPGCGKNCDLHVPRKLTFYRSATTTPDSVLIVATSNGLRRFDIGTSTVTKIDINKTDLSPRGVVCTAVGKIIFSCDLTNLLYAVDPAAKTGDVEQLTADPMDVSDICLKSDDSERLWFVENSRIRVVDVPPRLFCSSV
jgi:hypothetical protein